ncbi:unnamed protein product [Calypogeia fissa]
MDSSEQDGGDATIVWENPDTPANADDYIFLNGKRFVRPYFFEFVAHAKRRWAGKIIVEVYAEEFKGRPPEYYVQAVQNGRIRVDGRRVSLSTILRDSQKMSHFVHRHEPPVMAQPVKILEEGPDVITVCKPPSIPVHPCGQYRKNTVVGILEAEHKTGQLFPIHRLDRLVSGLLILARNAQAANRFRVEIEAGRVHKQYVAKVIGVFPSHEVEVNAAVFYDHREGVSTVETRQPGTGKGKGKEASTKFQRLRTDGVYSIVRCEPITGRTHQIRVHLQHLGHPIANDDLYLQADPPKRSREGCNADTAAKSARITPSNACLVGNPDDTVGAATTMEGVRCSERSSETKHPVVDTVEAHNPPGNMRDSVEATLTRQNIEDVSLDPRTPLLTGSGDNSIEPSSGRTKTALEGSHFPLPQERARDQTEGNREMFSVDVMCTHCPNLGPSGYENDEDGLWLHCVRYASPSWAYECPLPDWAL